MLGTNYNYIYFINHYGEVLYTVNSKSLYIPIFFIDFSNNIYFEYISMWSSTLIDTNLSDSLSKMYMMSITIANNSSLCTTYNSVDFSDESF